MLTARVSSPALRELLVRSISLLTIAPFFSCTSALAQDSVTPLPSLPGDVSALVRGVSGNGQVAFGTSYGSSTVPYYPHAVIWHNGVPVSIGILTGGTYSEAYGASFAGNVVVGDSEITGGDTHAFVWTNNVITDLGTLPGGTTSAANAISNNNVIVGSSDSGSAIGSSQAVTWVNGTISPLNTVAGSTASYASSVSADGSIIAGYSNGTGFAGQFHAMRWMNGAVTDLGTLSGATSSFALDVSANGTTIVGFSNIGAPGSYYHAVKWAGGTITDLGTLVGRPVSAANSVSADGSVIVGSTLTALNGGGPGRAFVWTQVTGMQDLTTALANRGVNMTGIVLNDATGVSDNGIFITANGTSQGVDQPFIVSYNGLATYAQQQQATQSLANSQRNMLISGHTTANTLLGMTRPMNSDSYTYSGGMWGSAMGMVGGQYSRSNVTLLGGLAYGSQDYANVEQSNALTLGLATRFSFGDVAPHVSPFVEVGGWATPNETLTFSRSYANGAGSATGTGNSGAYAWGVYGRSGLHWDIEARDRLSGWGELGRETLHYDGYSETLSDLNPFPATVSGDGMRYNVARLGSSLTHGLSDRLSVTISGNVAHSFDNQSNLRVNVTGFGMTQAANHDSTWGEYGAQLTMHLTEHLNGSIGVLGTTGDSGIGTQLHGLASLSYRF